MPPAEGASIFSAPSAIFSASFASLTARAIATNIIHEMSGGKHPKDRIWVNVLHAVDGAWGVNGTAMTNGEIKEAASKG